MERTEFVSSGRRVGGLAEIGDIVGYEDVANVWRAAEVVGLARHHITEVPNDYTLRYLDDQSTHFSDLRQYGWTFGKVYVPEGARLPITSAESQSYIDDGDLPDADDEVTRSRMRWAFGDHDDDDRVEDRTREAEAEDEDDEDDDGCPKNDPECLGNNGDCHDACEWPRPRILVDEYIPCAGGCG